VTTWTNRSVKVQIKFVNFTQIGKKPTCLTNLDELYNKPTNTEERSTIQISFRTQDPSIKKGTNPESAPKFITDPRSTVFSKSVNPLDLLQESIIHVLFKAKSVDPKTYSSPSPPSKWGMN